MSFVIENVSPETAVITIGATLDFGNAAEFRTMAETQVRAGTRRFILNFDNTIFIDSTGMGSIFSLYRQLRPMDGRIVFASVSRPVQVVVELTRSNRVFHQYKTVDAAFAAIDYEERVAS
jgi:anti-sigma B factor antagonist